MTDPAKLAEELTEDVAFLPKELAEKCWAVKVGKVESALRRYGEEQWNAGLEAAAEAAYKSIWDNCLDCGCHHTAKEAVNALKKGAK